MVLRSHGRNPFTGPFTEFSSTPRVLLLKETSGRSEGRSFGLAKIFNAANELPDGAIVFLDQLDSHFATRREIYVGEATRRMLSILLRQMDSFQQDKKNVVISATNRNSADLDPALFDTSVAFNLPDDGTREEIASSELRSLAAVSDGMSGHDIRHMCQQAERR